MEEELDEVKVFNLYPNYDKIYGPYANKAGRLFVILRSTPTGVKRTISYPKLLLEIHINRLLINDETTDHMDGNFRNNSIDNLRILTRSENAKYSWEIGTAKPLVATEEFKAKQKILKTGTKNGKSKLSELDVLDIRSRKKYHGLVRDLMKEFSISRKTVYNVLNNISYSNVEKGNYV